MARTRSRSNPNTTLIYRERRGYPLQNYTFSKVLTGDPLVMTEVIVDDPIPYSSYVKSCKHTRCFPIWSIPDVRYLGFPRCEYSNSFYHYAHLDAVFDGTVPTLTSIGAVNYSTRALRQMMPSVNEGTSLINFILELKDFRRIIQSLRVKHSLKKNLKDVSKEAIWDGSKSMKENVSNGILSYSFGWAPFVSDLKGIYDSLANLSNKLRFLRENEGKVLRRRYKRLLPGYDSSERVVIKDRALTSYQSDVPDSSYRMKTTTKDRWVQPPMYTATLYYRYKIPKMSDAEMKVRGFLDALGLRWDPSIIWEAIPFSFVTDWFEDVGGFLRSFSVDNLGLETEVLDFCHGIKAAQHRDIYMDCQNVSRQYLDPNGPGPRVVSLLRSSYERVRTTPSLHTLTGSSWDMRKSTLAGALVLAHVERKKRQRPTTPSNGSISDTQP